VSPSHQKRIGSPRLIVFTVADQVLYCCNDLSSLQINHNHPNYVFNAI
jgi:hypothetical protein